MSELNISREYQNLAKFVGEFVLEGDPMRRIDVTLRSIAGLWDTAAVMLLLREGKETLRVVASHDESGRGGIDGAVIPIRGSITGMVMQTHTPVNIPSVDLSPDYLRFSAAIRSELVVPLLWREQTLGVLNIESTMRNAFGHEDISRLGPYSTALAVAVSDLLESGQSESHLFETLKNMRQRQVLILGKDTPPEDVVLVKLADRVRGLGYVPLLVKAFPDFRELSNEDKVRVFADVSRFVLIENSYPAGQIAECKICAVNRIVTAMLRRRGIGSSYMVTDYDIDYGFMREFEYECTEDDLGRSLSEALTWAELQVRARTEYFDDRYPWRTRGPS